MKHHFIATCSLGFEEVLCKELRRLNIQHVKADIGTVRFQGPLRDGLRACLWSRLASRVLLRIHRFQGLSQDDLYEGIYDIPWEDHITPNGRLWIDFIGYSKQLRHSQFAARKAKDAIVDRFRDRCGTRPSVDKDADLRIHVHLKHGVFTVSIDLCGQPLHLRTPDRRISDAPLKETLAAALLHMSGWIKGYSKGLPLVDPMCGSGTIALEAIGIACNAAPNLYRSSWNFQRWLGHQPDIWKEIVEHAYDTRRPEPEADIYASDIDANAINACKFNAQKQNLPPPQLTCQPLKSLLPPTNTAGFIITNPPYGERIGSHAHVEQLYAELGAQLLLFQDWRAFLLCPPNELYQHTGFARRGERHTVRNGQIKCRFIELKLPTSTS